MLHLIMKVIVRRWFGHLGDSVPSVGRGGSWMCSLFCCLLCHLVGHSKWLLSWSGRNVGLLMCWSVSQLTFLHCFLFCYWSHGRTALLLWHCWTFGGTWILQWVVRLLCSRPMRLRSLSRCLQLWFLISGIILEAFRWIFSILIMSRCRCWYQNCTAYSRCGRTSDL